MGIFDRRAGQVAGTGGNQAHSRHQQAGITAPEPGTLGIDRNGKRDCTAGGAEFYAVTIRLTFPHCQSKVDKYLCKIEGSCGMKVVNIKTAVPEISRSKMETRLLTVRELESWTQPRFQRPIKKNSKVMEFCEALKKNGGIIDGILTLGQLPNDPKFYKVDGAHRIAAALDSGLKEF